MNSNFTTGFNKPSTFTAQTYGTKTTVEVDHSDLSLDEVMDAFQTLIIGMGYHENSFKSWVIERAEEYIETDAEDLKEKLEAWNFEDDDNTLRHSFGEWPKDSEGHENVDELENDFFGSWGSVEEEKEPISQLQYNLNRDAMAEEESNKRMNIIGQNGNEGLHYDTDMGADEDSYRATDEDEDEFSDDGGFDNKPHFEWGDEPEDDNLFEGDEWKPNQKMAEANERYKSEVKKMNSKKKKNKK
jgi:hypothetical protein